MDRETKTDEGEYYGARPGNDLWEGFPFPVFLQFIDDFSKDPMATVTKATVPGGEGTLIYAIGRGEPEVHEEGKPRVRKLIPVAVILPVDQYRRLVLRKPDDR